MSFIIFSAVTSTRQHVFPELLGPRGRLSPHCHRSESRQCLRSITKWAPTEDRAVSGFSRSGGDLGRLELQLWHGPAEPFSGWSHDAVTSGATAGLAVEKVFRRWMYSPSATNIAPSNGKARPRHNDAFRVTGLLWRGSNGHRRIPLAKDK